MTYLAPKLWPILRFGLDRQDVHVLDNVRLAIIMRRADNDDKAHCRHRGLVLSLGKPPEVLLILSF